MTFAANAQDAGTISGTVVNTWDGTPLPGVVVTVRGTTLAAQTGPDGRYQLSNVLPGEHVLRFFKPGFAATVVTETRVLAGQTTTLNGNLRPEFFEMEETTVTAEEFTEQTQQIIVERINAAQLMNAIGSADIAKFGARDVGEAIKNVTGVSVVGGKYVVVRGLSDRYTRTLLNGVEVPSADPYRMSPQLDLFPSAMVDRINVSKTFTPDQPGGTGGGTIDILTKSFPEKPFAKATIGTSYNPSVNLRDNFLHDPQANRDFLALPEGPTPLDPAFFGYTEQTLPNAGKIPNAVGSETRARAAVRRAQADAAQDFIRALGTGDFAAETGSTPLNSSFSASTGATVPLFKRNLGLFGGLNYNRNFRSINNGIMNRYQPGGDPERLGHETRGNILTDYGGNVNIGYDFAREDQPKFAQLGFNFMLAHSTDDEARHGHFPFVEGRTGNDISSLEMWQLHFTEREIQNYQLSGHHEMPVLGNARLDWVLGLSDTEQNEPDNRFMNYYVGLNGGAQFGDSSLPTPNQPARYYREIEEETHSYKVDWTQPLGFMKEETKLKAGFYNSNTERDFREQFFSYEGLEGFDVNNPNTYLNDPAYLNYVATKTAATFGTNYHFPRYVNHTFAHPYSASQDITAGYMMADIGVLPWLRLIGGARMEKTKMSLETEFGNADIDQTDWLPAASAVINFTKTFDLRLSYGETVARPSFREKAPIGNYLPDLAVTAFGNLDLQMSAVRSYDVRLEWFPNPGDVISAGAFYKELDGPIELISLFLSDDIVTWINRPGTAKLMGLEFELRKSLDFMFPQFKGLTLGANVTLIESETDLSDIELASKALTDPNPASTRPLYDQSPYIANFDLSYQHPTSGTAVTIGANLTGPRIALSKLNGPDIYEHPPITLDAALTQKFGKHFSMRFGVRNILDWQTRYTYGSSFRNANIFQNYRRGPTYGLSLSAEF